MSDTSVLNILLVDDQNANLVLLSQYIENSDFYIDTATSASIALQKLHSQKFDIVFLDLIMPEMSGMELLKIIKSTDDFKDLFVVIVSAVSQPQLLSEAFNLGASDFVKRPIDRIELLARMKAVIRTKLQEDELKRLNEELFIKNEIISESIKSARIIQKAIFPPDSVVDAMFPGSSVFFKPKATVSGDFYWLGESATKQYIIGADCTGHGIAGAMLSIIASILINQIVQNDEADEAGVFLEKLNERYNKSINKFSTDIDSYLFDGMDVSVAIIDKRLRKISFSSARQNIYIYDCQQKFHVLKGDDYSIGYEMGGDPHFLHYEFGIDLVSGFVFFTDGIVDQHGGGDDKNERFGSSRFFEMHKHHSQKEMQTMAETAFLQWKGDKLQTDDVLYLSIIL